MSVRQRARFFTGVLHRISVRSARLQGLSFLLHGISVRSKKKQKKTVFHGILATWDVRAVAIRSLWVQRHFRSQRRSNSGMTTIELAYKKKSLDETLLRCRKRLRSGYACVVILCVWRCHVAVLHSFYLFIRSNRTWVSSPNPDPFHQQQVQ